MGWGDEMDEARLERIRRACILGFLAFAMPLLVLLWNAKHGGSALPPWALVVAMASYLFAFGLLLASLAVTLWLKYRRGGVSVASLWFQIVVLAMFALAVLGTFGKVLVGIATS